MTASTPEGKLKAACRAWMREQGAYVFSPVQVGLGATTLDDLVCYRGWFIGIEYKRPDIRPKPTVRQRLTIKQIERAAGLTLVCHELDEIRTLFQKGPPSLHVSRAS